MTDLSTSIRISVVDAFTPGLRKLGLELKDIERETKKLKTDHFQLAANLNQAAEGAGRFGMALAASLKDPIDSFASLDQALARVSAKTGEGRGSAGFEALKKQAIDLGAATKYSAEQVAQAEAEYAASGRNTQEILGAIPSTLSLATAGQIDLARATEITNEVLNQFNISSAQTAHVQDVLARADEVSAAGVNDLGEALSYAGATAARMNIPLETTSALLAALANAGQKGSTGGTELSAMLSAIVAPSKQAKKALHEMGLSLQEIKDLQTQVATGDIDVALRKLATLNSKLAPRQSAELLDKIFGERGGRAASVLFRASLDTSDKGIGSLIQKFHEADGAVNRTAKIMEESLAGSLEKAQGAVKGLSTQLGEAMAPTVKDLSKKVADWADGASDLAKEYPGVVRGGAELVGVLAALALTLKVGLSAASTYASAMGVLNGAMLQSTVTLGALSAAQWALVGAAGAAGYAIGSWADRAFNLSDKISGLLGKPSQDTGNSGLNEGQAGRGYALTPAGLIADLDPKYLNKRVYGQHKDASGKTVTGWYNKHVVPGKELPADVREALAAGATSIEEANSFILNKKTIRSGLGQGPAPQVEQVSPEVKPYEGESVAQIQKRIDALEKLSQQGVGVRAPDAAAAETLKLLKDIREELKKGNRKPSLAPVGTPLL